MGEPDLRTTQNQGRGPGPGGPGRPEASIHEERSLLGGELARAYVPVQVYTRRLSPTEGWKAGTIFPELIRPYTPAARRGRRRK